MSVIITQPKTRTVPHWALVALRRVAPLDPTKRAYLTIHHRGCLHHAVFKETPDQKQDRLGSQLGRMMFLFPECLEEFG